MVSEGALLKYEFCFESHINDLPSSYSLILSLLFSRCPSISVCLSLFVSAPLCILSCPLFSLTHLFNAVLFLMSHSHSATVHVTSSPISHHSFLCVPSPLSSSPSYQSCWWESHPSNQSMTENCMEIRILIEQSHAWDLPLITFSFLIYITVRLTREFYALMRLLFDMTIYN